MHFLFIIYHFTSVIMKILKQILPLLCSFSKNCFACHQRKLRSLWCKTNCMFLKSIRVVVLTISFFFSTLNRTSRVGGYNNDYSFICNSRSNFFRKNAYVTFFTEMWIPQNLQQFEFLKCEFICTQNLEGVLFLELYGFIQELQSGSNKLFQRHMFVDPMSHSG